MNDHPLVDKRMFLGAIPLFESLSQGAIDTLLQQTAELHLAAGKIVVSQGEPGTNMFIITHGSAQVSLHLADKEDVVVGKLQPGDAFGEIALFDQQPRTATVTTCEPSRFMTINREDFNAYLMQHPQVAIQLLTTLSKRLRAASDLLQDSVYCSVSHRLASTLNKLAHAYGKQTPDGLLIDIPFGDQELATIADIPVDVASAHLQHWCKDGVIRRDKQSLTVVQPLPLEQ